MTQIAKKTAKKKTAAKTAMKPRRSPNPRASHTSKDAGDLKRLPSTALYEPVAPGRGEQMWFLLWDAAGAPEFLTFDRLWADEGAPQRPGYLLFFNKLPPAGQAAAVEAQLRANPDLPPPPATGFAWLKSTASGPVKVSLTTLLKIRLNTANRASVDGDTPVKLANRIETVVFPNGALCLGHHEAGKLTGVASTYAPRDKDPPPNGYGVLLPLAGAQAYLVGCLCFTGLTNWLSPGKDPTRQRKSLMSVSIDPLNPLDTRRNFQLYTGKDFLLSGSGGSYRLAPV